MNVIAQFFWDFGRQGTVSATFVTTKEDIASLIGKFVVFREILGKHSDICGRVEEKDITIMTDDQEFIAKYIEIFGMSQGYNPFDYLPEEDEE